MMSLLAAIHAVAVRRGEGLLPELENLMERSKSGVQVHREKVRSDLASLTPDPDPASGQSPRDLAPHS
jgi:hypothetical protein